MSQESAGWRCCGERRVRCCAAAGKGSVRAVLSRSSCRDEVLACRGEAMACRGEVLACRGEVLSCRGAVLVCRGAAMMSCRGEGVVLVVVVVEVPLAVAVAVAVVAAVVSFPPAAARRSFSVRMHSTPIRRALPIVCRRSFRGGAPTRRCTAPTAPTRRRADSGWPTSCASTTPEADEFCLRWPARRHVITKGNRMLTNVN